MFWAMKNSVFFKTRERLPEKMLAKYQTEVDRIRTGVATRDELSKIHTRHITLEKALGQFCTKMVADGSTPRHIAITENRILRLCGEADINSVVEIRRETVERWVADEVKKKVLAPSTINGYMKAMKSFAQYLTDIELLTKNLLKPIKKLNATIEQRKKRRAMTAEEIERLLHATTQSKISDQWKTGERILIYQLLLGTGLRSTELSLLTPNQIDFNRYRLRIEAAKTKNKKADVLPIREDLVQSVKEWVTLHGIPSHERIFGYNKAQLLNTFYKDLQACKRRSKILARGVAFFGGRKL